jgi:hypothetical protein
MFLQLLFCFQCKKYLVSKLAKNQKCLLLFFRFLQQSCRVAEFVKYIYSMFQGEPEPQNYDMCNWLMNLAMCIASLVWTIIYRDEWRIVLLGSFVISASLLPIIVYLVMFLRMKYSTRYDSEYLRWLLHNPVQGTNVVWRWISLPLLYVSSLLAMYWSAIFQDYVMYIVPIYFAVFSFCLFRVPMHYYLQHY